MGSNYTYTFLYDDKNRLTDAVTTLTGASESYSYNLDGRIETKNRNGNNLEYEYWSGNNRLQKVIKNGTDTVNYGYDTKGNIYGGYGVLKEYNYQNLPTEMFNEDSTVYKYSYNSNGKRIKKTNAADNSGEYYLRDYTGRELVIYDNETGEAKSVNVFGNGLVGRIEINGTTDERFYYLKDLLGSIRATLNQYSTIVSAQDYFPYGEAIRNYVYGMPLEKYKFVGKERDTESGYDLFGVRYYDSKLGIWYQVDPWGHLYHGYSPYNYALCDPVNKYDPDGRWVWGVVIGAAVELASQVTADILVNDMSFSDALGNVDWADVGVAAVVGLATGGVSSLKNVGTIGKIGIQAVGSVAEGTAKSQIGNKTYDYNLGDATSDALLGGVSGVAGEFGKKVAQGTETAKSLDKTAKRLSNIAESGRARPAQALRAAKAAKAAATYGTGPAAESLQKGSEETVKQIIIKEKEKDDNR